MSRSLRRDLAQALGRHLIRVMPGGRADWAAGMKAEIEAIDDPEAALGFAVGCVRAGYGRRLRTVSGALTAMRWSIATVTVLFAVLVLANGFGALVQGLPSPLTVVFGVLGLAFLLAGLTLASLGPGSLAAISAVMLAVNTAALWMTRQTVVVQADVDHALIVEGYGLWTALLLVGLTLHGAARSTRLTALARARGWDG